jgi:hypothetical protein
MVTPSDCISHIPADYQDTGLVHDEIGALRHRGGGPEDGGDVDTSSVNRHDELTSPRSVSLRSSPLSPHIFRDTAWLFRGTQRHHGDGGRHGARGMSINVIAGAMGRVTSSILGLPTSVGPSVIRASNVRPTTERRPGC